MNANLLSALRNLSSTSESHRDLYTLGLGLFMSLSESHHLNVRQLARKTLVNMCRTEDTVLRTMM